MVEGSANTVADFSQVQLITDDLDYNAEIEQWMKDKDMMKCGTDYRTVAVIGCQSSGKSTLLNLIFDTTFVVMDEQKGRQQTTKGIWLNRNEAGNILVLDIEGTDSKERGEQRMTFEQTTSLFALAMADVLLINMWTTDIGRYGASNYGLLKVIFEANLKLFDQASSKKLLFVLRDYDNRIEAKTIMSLLQKDINNIWSEIYKPEKYAESKPEDFF
jgi:GTPase Era involved in 16S rRNA processing